MASIASLLVPGVTIPTPDTSWIGGAADTIVGGMDKYKQNKSFNKLADLIGQQPGQRTSQMVQPTQAGFLAGLGPRQQQQTMAAPLTAVDRSAAQGDTYEPFISTVKGKITNPYGLAAVAATGRAESGWSSGNANRTWSDPSQSGQPGTAGGVMSWRGPRLEAMQNFAAQRGERLGAISPQTQAEFFLQEDPNLIATLNSARSPEEAADAMAKAWAFAGHDNPGQGEAARRRAMTTNYAAQFRDMPNAGLAAIDAQAAPSGSLSGDPAVTVADPLAYGSGQAPATDPAIQSAIQPLPEQSFGARFGQTTMPAELAQGRDGLAAALALANADPRTTQTMDRLAPSGAQPLPDQAFDDRFGPTALPAEIVQGADGLAGALASSNRSAPVPTPSDGVTSAVQAPAAVSQPVQVADASGGFAGVPGVQPIPRGGVPIELIQTMLRDPNLRDIGVKLWAQNVEGPKANEPFQFVTLPDGTFARANQQTGEVEPLGNFGKRQQEFNVLTPQERQALGIPDTDQRVYQRGADGKIDAIGGAGQTINVGNEVEARRQAASQAGLTPDDPAYQGFILTGKLPRENEQTLTATDKKAILEADEMVQSTQNVLPLIDRALELNDQAYSGPTAGIRGTVGGAVGLDGGVATQELDNVVVNGALTQLKAIFGGAPTEGERAILMDMSGASSKPAPVRKTIFERAKQAAQRRLQFYQDRANDIRGGTYYKPGNAADKGNRTSSGVQWSIEE